MDDMTDPRTVDASGTFCPVPILKLARAVRGRAAGEEWSLVATDPAVCADLRSWCASTGHELLELSETSGPPFRGRVRLRSRGAGR